MALTLQVVRARIDLDEVNYPELAADLGADALPHLQTLAAGRDPMVASKAAYLAAMIGGPNAMPVLEVAERRVEPEVRVAVASALRHVDEQQAETIADRLLSDADIGVRKMTVKAVSRLASPRLKARIQHLRQSDPDPFIRDLAGRVMER